MTRLLFVDDDIIIRRALEQNIPWEQEGFRLCHVAVGGMDALEYAMHHELDLVLADIQMPVMDGLEMAQQMKLLQPELFFVFLSGHEDFTYAKAALKVNAYDYLTKPISDARLLEVLHGAQAEIDKKQKQRTIIAESIPALRRQFLAQSFSTHTLDYQAAAKYGIQLEDGMGLMGKIVFHLTPASSKRNIALYAHHFCETVEAEIPGLLVIPKGVGAYYFLRLTGHRHEDDAHYMAETEVLMKNCMLNHTQCDYTLHMGTPFHALPQLLDSFEDFAAPTTPPQMSLCTSIQQYLDEHYADPTLTLRTIAEHFNVNHCHMTTTFKKHMGIGVYDYLIRVRMEKAKELLLTSQLKSTQVAERVGYLDSQYFAKSFKKHFGISYADIQKHGVP